MYSFATEQRSFEICGARFGGQPGEYPTVLFGTVCYGRAYQRLTRERMEEVKGYISTQAEMSALTGNPGVVDIFIDRVEHVAERIELVASVHDGPISLDIPEAETRIAALEHCAGTGMLGRVIYNSLNMGLTEAEAEALRAHSPKAAICLAYNPKDLSTDGRLAILETGAGVLDKGLVAIASELGMDNVLLDTAATPFDHGACEALRAIPVLKHKFGLPVGCAIHNTVESWLWMKDYRKTHQDAYAVCDAGSSLMPILLGANFLVYGPMRNCRLVFPAAAMADKLVAEGAEDYFGVEAAEEHPRRRLP
ncbi:MAG: tetrahydromethanopterin S-methyltransferase subunit H [Candidatus Thermoplasmatota archaeon]